MLRDQSLQLITQLINLRCLVIYVASLDPSEINNLTIIFRLSRSPPDDVVQTETNHYFILLYLYYIYIVLPNIHGSK